MKIQPIGLLAILVFLFGNTPVSASTNKRVINRIITPDYINFQYVGNLGLGSVGVGSSYLALLALGTLDYYLFNRIKYDRFKFIDCLNICMGITIPLNKNRLASVP